MAMNDERTHNEPLDPARTRTAAGVATALAALAAVGTVFALIAYLTGAEARFEIVAWLIMLLIFCGVGALGGIQLLRGSRGAQQFLLVYWLGVAVVAVTASLALIFWRVPEGLAEALGGSVEGMTPWATLLAVALLVLSALVVVLLTAASRENTRQRYASMAVVSVAVVLALVMAVNMLSQYESPRTGRANYVHFSMETLGRYGLGERTKKILEGVDRPLHITCVYTAADKDMKTAQRRERVLEMLEDMKLYGEKITVEDVRTDAQKAEVLQRLRGDLGKQAGKHEAFLRSFQEKTEALMARLNAQQQRWQAHPRDSYLNMWAIPVEISDVLASQSEKLQRVGKDVTEGLAGPGLPDYEDLSSRIKDSSKELKDLLDRSTEFVEDIRVIAKAATNEEKRQTVIGAVTRTVDAAGDMTANLGAGDANASGDPAKRLGKHVELARRTAQLATAAAGQLDNLAGKDNAELLRQNRHFAVEVQRGMLPVQVTLSDFLRMTAQRLTQDAEEAEAVAKNAKPDYQEQFIAQTRQAVGQTVASLKQAASAATEFVGRLAKVDEPSRAAFELVDKEALFGELDETLQALLDAHKDLPELEDTTISADISGENIVIIEAGGEDAPRKAEVVTFDEVWQPKGGPDFGGGDEPRQRVFHGDAAIGSRILKMTNEPFALVLLAYWGAGPEMPPQMRQMIPPSDIPLEQLSTVRERLQQANFAVEDWNLNEDMPDPNEHADRPKLLIVLPPPPAAPQSPWQRQPQPTPKFTDAHRRKVVDAVDRGIPAVFLASFSPPRRMNMFMPPMQTPYAYGDYLRDEWGIDVLTDYLVIPAVSDEKMPGRYKVDGQRFSYLPLSSFTDHPIGKPLQAQRVLWTNLCPVVSKRDVRGRPAEAPEGVEISPILGIPASWQSTWATRRIEDLLRQFQGSEGSYIWPDYEAGDLRAPFDVAVAATRSVESAEPESTQPAAGPDVQPARLVVLGAGASLMDGYLSQDVAVREADGTISLRPPPRANADLLINSVYWLTGRETLIASGPVQATMKAIPPTAKIALAAVYCGLLPAAVIGIGLLVMFKRRR